MKNGFNDMSVSPKRSGSFQIYYIDKHGNPIHYYCYAPDIVNKPLYSYFKQHKDTAFYCRHTPILIDIWYNNIIRTAINKLYCLCRGDK